MCSGISMNYWDILQTFNWETGVALIFIVIGLLKAIPYLKELKPKSRSKLKTDIKILKMLNEDDPQYDTIRNSINEDIRAIYGRKDEGIGIYNPGDLVGGLILLVFSTLGFSYVVQQNYTLIFRVPLIVAFVTLILGSIGGILKGFSKDRSN